MVDFKKIIALIILFFTFCNVNSYSEVVNKVDVQGNDRISLETIMVFGDIAIGKNCIIGAGSLVIDNIKDDSKAFGVPAKIYIK